MNRIASYEKTPNPCECEDHAVSRRSLLKTAAVLTGGAAITQLFGDSMLQASFGGTAGGNTLVVISLRGGIDGMGVVVPHGDPGYYSSRPRTGVPASSLLCADAMFGLHPKMAPLTKYWASGELAAIQAVGLPFPNRSHFSAVEQIEGAAPGSTIRTGWINRMVGQASTHPSPANFQAVTVGQSFPTAAMTGPNPTLATSSLSKLQVVGIQDWAAQRYGSLQTAWSGSSAPGAASAREALFISQGPGTALANAADNPAVAYPTSSNASAFVGPMKSAAKLIRADLGTDVISIDAGNWDLHTDYGTQSSGSMQSKLEGFSAALAAFLADVEPQRQRVTVLTISEFGRRVGENGSGGFDHGWGNMMLVAGAGVKGGRYYGNWPGLDRAALVEDDLKVTTDYRQVLSEVVARRFPDRSLSGLFPEFKHSPIGFMN